MKTKRVGNLVGKEKELLLRVARTIGSTLGTVAAKVNGAPKHARRGRLSGKLNPKGRKVRKQNARSHNGRRSTRRWKSARTRSSRS
jgi:hypothetical protein